jgi:hypothetical protein
MRKYIFGIVCLFGCGTNPSIEKHPYMAKGGALDNYYTQIVSKICGKGMGEFVYTDSNTTCFTLNELDSEQCFVFASELVCGHAGGSCGNEISVYQKQGQSYTIVYQSCGFHLKSGIQQQSGIRSFKFETKEAYQILVKFLDGRFVEDTIAINGLDYKLAKAIAKPLHLQAYDLMAEGAKSSSASYQVWKEPFRLSANKTLDLVTVNTPGTDYFLMDQGKVVFHINDVYSFEVATPAQGEYPALKVYDYGHVRQSKDTSYFEGSVYRYNLGYGVYMPE